MKLKVEGNPSLVRDSRSKAIILEDQESYKVYLNEKRFREKVAQTSNNVETEMVTQALVQDSLVEAGFNSKQLI